MTHLLEILNINKVYRDGRGIKNISLNIDKGEIYGILGGIKSGKTTIMRIVAGDLHADSGNIIFEGEKIGDKISQKVKSLYNPPYLYDKLTAKDHLKLAEKNVKKIDRQEIDNLLNLTKLSDYVLEPVREYTECMKLRLRLALILLSAPKLLIIDEPDIKIDMEGMFILRNILLEQVKKGTSVLISSKNILQMELMCNRVAILKQGQVAAKSSMKDILLKHLSLESYYNYSMNSHK